ncbi:MAG TPA: oligoendopeptidase F [Thermoanaerobaculaceae bacterium]|nr:oligoendopeptidase F [Thermoanaerobaculaceae bacterium]
MARIWVAQVVVAGLMTGTVALAAGTQVVEKYRWNLGDLYATPQAFDAARQQFAGRLPELDAHRGKLGGSPAAMKSALDLYFSLAKELGRLGSYASMRSDEDTRVAEALGARQEVMQLASEFSSHSSWIAPEVLALPAGTVAKFLAAEPGLAPYRFFLEDIERQRPHTLSQGEEKILAEAGLVSPAPSTIYGVLANADLPFPEVTLSNGQKVRLDQSAYTKYRALPDRADRILVFREFWKAFAEYQRTFGTTLDAEVKRDLFYARARNYPSCLAAALDGSNVPEAVYRTLIAEANRALPTLYRAFRLRGRLLGITDLAYHDIYPPLVKHVDMSFPIDKGEALVLQALAPLGNDYVETVRKGFDSRWMDVYPQQGKRSGAYSNGSAYDVHPYVLMNYNDDYESVSTVAHEWGHAMHSYLANKAQPYPTADYSIFVAEVASTFNEALLLRQMLDRAATDDERLFLLGNYLEGLRGTFFRQAMFAEFELAIHEAAEKGEALTGAKLTKMYGELLRRYHGNDQGVMRIPDEYTVEWAYIPHFYMNFYVYQYATSLAASTQLAREVMDGKPGAKDRYLGLLKAGGSRYPYELLKDAGVDLASPAPYRALEAQMNWAMDEIEKIVARRPAAPAK